MFNFSFFSWKFLFKFSWARFLFICIFCQIHPRSLPIFANSSLSSLSSRRSIIFEFLSNFFIFKNIWDTTNKKKSNLRNREIWWDRAAVSKCCSSLLFSIILGSYFFSKCLSAGSLAISLFNIWSSRCFMSSNFHFLFYYKHVLGFFFPGHFPFPKLELAFSWNLMDIYLSCLLLFLKLQFLFFFTFPNS